MEAAPGGDSTRLNATYTNLSADDDGESLQRFVADLYARCQRAAGDGTVTGFSPGSRALGWLITQLFQASKQLTG